MVIRMGEQVRVGQASGLGLKPDREGDPFLTH